MAKSLDIGTMYLVKGEIDNLVNAPSFLVERNCFLQASKTEDTEETLQENKWNYVKYDNEYYILGEDAIKLKNLLTVKSGTDDANIVMTKVGKLRRPMKDGVLNTGDEKLSVAIIQKIIANLVGKPSSKDEVLCFCAPGDPIDNNLSVVFHKTMLTSYLNSLGYSVECIPEALAIIFSENPIANDPDEEGGKAPFSGIAISCLPAGQKVITNRGFVNIEDVAGSDNILTKNGEWRRVVQPTSRNYDGEVIEIKALGHGSIRTTSDHLIWVQRSNKWQWVAASDVKIGDYVMQPWIKNYDTNKRIYAYWSDRTTCAEPKKVQQEVTGEMAELIGYFLGDGHIEQHDQCVAWTFSCDEEENISRMKELCVNLFGKECSENNHCENDIRLKLYNKGLASWLRRECYNYNGEKKVPFNIIDMGDTLLMHLIRGLVMSDGWFLSDGFGFSNTSSNLAQFVFLGTQKLGLKPSMHIRPPRDGANPIDNNDRTICGKLEEYTITCNGAHSNWYSLWIKHPSRSASKSFIDGMSIARVNKIEREEYHGIVHDLIVDDDSHSFCLPGFAIHNCGAGMVNTVLSWKKMPLIAYSTCRSGDWIDREAAKVAGIDVSAMTRYKESKLNLDKIDQTDMRQVSLDIFYQNMIEYTLNALSEKFNKLDNRIETPLEIVVAGGTSMVPGFMAKFEAVLNSLKLPFNVKGVRHAANPFYAVSNGCLAKAIASEKRKLAQ